MEFRVIQCFVRQDQINKTGERCAWTLLSDEQLADHERLMNNLDHWYEMSKVMLSFRLSSKNGNRNSQNNGNANLSTHPRQTEIKHNKKPYT